ncbi:hybrid-cluster NAD(P)-dependent oxidoreductase [Metarhizobium album]|uniref:Hybrid-cluster NAD(P)-dependent oxidoreductase n=1 Tax=Metarhizobium album TaxID=2182425 RepID=A0A2U2DMY1_9HYPH|nr:hybrid-cluster NAD(P)-dependent oxidoreductase [Rhizobium album]PWE54661.1 hybrid-cluster NAD(P)-dependent oxidoreductase [Rhizobium album]
MDTKSQFSPAERLHLADLWNRDADEDLVCIDVHQETHDVKTFTFASPEGKRFAFEAGQYFLFDLEVGGEPESRCYSISSSPRRNNAFSVTVKRVAGGKISNWLHDTLTIGSKVKANGPLGHFIRPNAKKYLFLSGGSGITPVMAMVRELADTCEPADVVFLHAGRSPKDLIFRDDLACLAARMKGLRLQFLPETVLGETQWPGLTGRISADYMKLAVPDLAERIVMCCGPAPFMAAARSIAADLGVPPQNYIEESFDAAVIDEVDIPVVEEAVTRTFQVSFAKQARQIDVSGDQTVLSCAKKAGIKLPSSCSNGVCGTCKSKLVSGTVDMNHNGGIRQREIDAGLFLPCCSKPLSDLVIDR